VPALAGLARVLAADDPEEAAALARRAVELGPGLFHVQALLAAGWVAHERGDRDGAAAAADEAAAAARARRDLPGLAEALELAAASCGDAPAAVAHLEEALAIWHGVGNSLGAAWAELGLATASEGERRRELAERAARRFRGLGARRGLAAAERVLAELDAGTAPRVAIHTLGAFGVVRGGDPVPLSEWQSKKARALLKLLVARRGRPVTREALMEALWPEGDPAKLGNRLSVALATVRGVLGGGDPAAAEAVVADQNAIRLDLEAVDVDVERFLAAASAGLAARRHGPSPEVAELLERAEALYAGEFLEEDAYEDWPVALREEVRDAYIAVARALADDALGGGEADAAARYLLRILERDGYDERAHLELVRALSAAGRHGDARRRYRLYATRMEEIGVEATPFPG
jgi:DNA-binding SARP family transcriptional activator